MEHRKITSNIVSAVAFWIIVWVVASMPFRIIGYGFLPPDDALRHSAKVVSEKNWNEILVLRDETKMDAHQLGWHAILDAVHKITDWDAHYLVLFSVISLFIIFSLLPLAFLRYPESWIMSLVVLAIAIPGWFFRLFLGRPYILVMSCLLAISFLWPSLKNKKIPYKTIILFTFLIAAATWVHCAWYLFALPIIAFFLAREWRACSLMSISTVLGILIGAACTGHPIMFLEQTISVPIVAFLGDHETARMLATEFWPTLPSPHFVAAIGGVLIWLALRGKWKRSIVDNPLFILGALTFVLGLMMRRVWIDWGIPVMAVWMAKEFDEFLSEKIHAGSFHRLALTIPLVALFYLSVTTDAGSRWSGRGIRGYLSQENAEQVEWLPGEGGIIYSNSMSIFYQTFNKNPHAKWRYILGFEPTLMPAEDLAVFRDIQRSFGSPESFKPWVEKMKPEDRLVLKGHPERKPKIPGLEWHYAAYATWIGRKSKIK